MINITARNPVARTSKRFLAPCLWLASVIVSIAATVSQKMPVAFKWEPFEVTFNSSVNYTNALQQAELDGYFVSPDGVTNRVPGFWDGAKVWRLRFAPDAPGRWTYFTRCTDERNKGLHEQSGAFVCTAATGKSIFGEHGPIRVAKDHRHLEHTDRQPFLWLGDVTHEGARRAEPAQWEFYARIRSAQKFNAVLWSLAPGKDTQDQSAFGGGDVVSINVPFFKNLDLKVEALNRAGLLNAIAPLWDIGNGVTDDLSEEQLAKLLRYAVARWGANDVAWVLAFEAESDGRRLARWKNAGRSVFSDISHAPVVLFPGEATWALDEFRHEKWVDVFGFNTAQAADDSALPWLLNGPLALERRKEPARPLITLLPPAESLSGGKSVTAEQARRLLWWSVLVNTPAGVTYATRDISDWNITKATDGKPAWQAGLILPGAYDVASLEACFRNIEYWRLRPYPRALAEQPADAVPASFIAAAGTEDRDLTVIYTPGGPSVAVTQGAIPNAAQARWLDPRTGRNTTAVATMQGDTCRFATPGAGDWFLVLKPGKPTMAAR